MNRVAHKLQNFARRKHRVRAVVSGTTERPRLSVHVSNMHVSAQLIDDTKHETIAQVSTVGQKAATGTMTERAAWIGTEIAKKAKAKKIKSVVFDRGGRLYHGRIKALADAARAGGLEF
jgi:large subunit ribosomal protein L18